MLITVSIGTRAVPSARRVSRHDRLDTSVGPLSVEVHRRAAPGEDSLRQEEWGIEGDLVFTGTVAALEEPRTFVRQYGRVIQDVTRTRKSVRGRAADRRRAHVRRHSRQVEGRARPIMGVRRSAARSARYSLTAEQDGLGFRHDWLPMQFDDHCSRGKSTKTPTAIASSKKPPASGTSIRIDPSKSSVAPRSTSSTSAARRDALGHRAHEDPKASHRRDEKPRAHAVPRRRVRLRQVDGKWGHGMYQGPLKVEGIVHDLSDPRCAAATPS